MSTSDIGIHLSIAHRIGTLTLNQPARHNALNGDDLRQIRNHLDAVANNNEIRVLIITGAGSKTFCAGAALNELGSGDMSGEQFAEMTDAIAQLAIPTICAMNGSAFGGGTEIGLACDFRIGVEGMRLFVPPARIGLCYPVLGIERFVSRLGVNTAKRLLLASEEFSAPQLLELGYLTHLVAPEQLQQTTRHLAERMAGYGPVALSAMKKICDQAALGSLDLDWANQLANQCNQSNDLKEGFAALREKRAPHFNGN